MILLRYLEGCFVGNADRSACRDFAVAVTFGDGSAKKKSEKGVSWT